MFGSITVIAGAIAELAGRWERLRGGEGDIPAIVPARLDTHAGTSVPCPC